MPIQEYVKEPRKTIGSQEEAPLRPDRNLISATSGRLCHLLEEGLLALPDLLGRQVLDVLRQPPPVAERILQLAGAIAPEHVVERHEHCRSRVYCALPGGIDLVDVDVEA